MATNSASTASVSPDTFPTILGHPRPLWMLFMSEFWERFAFYGIRWALVLYIVAQFHGGDQAGQAPANLIYGSYLALVYAAAIFGGYIADRVLGYQRSIMVGNGMFKPNISTMVGKLYGQDDPRRDSGFTIFYMGINLGAFVSPIVT